jgi:hypothetical protein
MCVSSTGLQNGAAMGIQRMQLLQKWLRRMVQTGNLKRKGLVQSPTTLATQKLSATCGKKHCRIMSSLLLRKAHLARTQPPRFKMFEHRQVLCASLAIRPKYIRQDKAVTGLEHRSMATESFLLSRLPLSPCLSVTIYRSLEAAKGANLDGK